MRTTFLLISFSFLTTIAIISQYWAPILWSLVVILPLFILGVYDILQKRHAILRNFPVIGHFRYLLEGVRPEIMQYFVETDTEGMPFNRLNRSLIYQRSKNVTDTRPFGTQKDTYEAGYEWINHSMYPKKIEGKCIHPRVMIGEKNCSAPYSCSIFNVSAMSFGSLSYRAIRALNGGAKLGHFAHNTGEGGVSPHHLEEGGDLIWQIGTGYFGCRSKDGGFSLEKYQETMQSANIKMVELKLSQGAKPGHGGILPAKKNTPEIASIRGVEAGTDVLSPPYHKAFDSALGLLEFISLLRAEGNGRPVGFKLCVGKREEFIEICEAMKSSGLSPDFITVDGGEGGTGAAPKEFSDSVGTPYMDGISFVDNTLRQYGLRQDIKLAASGKLISGFDIAKAIALGADFCYSARAMMMALGCIQALECNTNNCPVGVATQDKELVNGLNISDKRQRVYHFHKKTIHGFTEILGAAGLNSPCELNRSHIYRRINQLQVMTYEEIYPSLN